tara:strand:- start:53 stop:598 length:546 start_codon:yes stop_codon:yes gene_type:complete
MSEKYDYRDLFPGDKEWERNSFYQMVCHLIDDWPRIKSEGSTWPTPAVVNAELDKLREAINNLSEYTRDQIIGRERDTLNFMSQEWIDAGKGQSSLEILENLVALKYERSGRSDGQARRHLGYAALNCWHSAGGITWDEKDGRAVPVDKGKFLDFLEMIFRDIGEEEYDTERMYRDIFGKR